MKKKKLRNHNDLVLDASYDVDRETVELLEPTTYSPFQGLECDEEAYEDKNELEDLPYLADEEIICETDSDEETACDPCSQDTTNELDKNDRPQDEFHPPKQPTLVEEEYLSINLKSLRLAKLNRDRYQKFRLFGNRHTETIEPILAQGAKPPFKPN